MNSSEPQGVLVLGLDPAVGSTLVANHTVLRRKVHAKPIAPRPPRFLYWAYERWLLRQLQ